MLAQEPRQPQQAQGVLQAELLGFGPLGQGGPLGLGHLVTDLAQLHVGPVLAEQQVHLLAGVRVFAQGFGTLHLLFEDQLGLVGIQVGRGDFTRQGGLDQLLGAVLAHPLGFQVGAEAADPHHTGQALKSDGAGGGGINVAFPLLHLGFQA